MVEPPRPIDKLILAVTFLTALAGLYGYKDQLNQMQIFLFLHPFSIFDCILYMAGFLCLSIYISSIANLRYIYKKLTESNFLSTCDKIGDFLYLFAIVGVPTSIVIGFIISTAVSIINQLLYNYISNIHIIYIIISFIGIIITILVVFFILLAYTSDPVLEALLMGLATNTLYEVSKTILVKYLLKKQDGKKQT